MCFIISKNKSSRVIVDLLRIDLQFEITHEKQIRSLQYSNMRVSLDQYRFKLKSWTKIAWIKIVGLIERFLLEPTENFAELKI